MGKKVAEKQPQKGVKQHNMGGSVRHGGHCPARGHHMPGKTLASWGACRGEQAELCLEEEGGEVVAEGLAAGEQKCLHVL